jgi:hypothetical protein
MGLYYFSAKKLYICIENAAQNELSAYLAAFKMSQCRFPYDKLLEIKTGAQLMLQSVIN